MARPSEWLAEISIEANTDPSGDVVFVSTDTEGSPGGLKSEILSKLNLKENIIPRAGDLESGYRFVSIHRNTQLCFVVTVGKGDPAAALTKNWRRL
jgi:hypothetical protein